MSSNLKVNTILPSTGTTIGIGTVGGLINVVGNIDVNSTSGISTFNGLEISGIVTAKAGAAVTYYGDGSNLTGITSPAITSIGSDGAGRVLTSDGDGTATAHSFVTIESSRLSVNRGSGSGAFPLIVRRTDASGIIAEFSNSSGYGIYLGQNSATGEAYIRTATGQPLVFTTNSGSGLANERLRITSDGRVGIATYTPTAAWLDIATGSGTYDHIRMRRISSDANIASNWSLKPYGGNLYFRTGGSTDKIYFDDSGDLNIMDGNLIMGTSGHGIDFAATGDAAGNTSELLDDYEEGSWTPAIAFDVGGSGIQYGTRGGTYVKIGRMVHLQYYMNVTGGVSSSDYFARLALPFTGISVQHQDARIRQWNSGNSDWFVSLGGSNPVFFKNNSVGGGGSWARGDSVNQQVLSGEYTLYV